MSTCQVPGSGAGRVMESPAHLHRACSAEDGKYKTGHVSAAIAVAAAPPDQVSSDTDEMSPSPASAVVGVYPLVRGGRAVLRGLSPHRRGSNESFSSVKELRGDLVQAFAERRLSCGPSSLSVECTDGAALAKTKDSEEHDLYCSCGHKKWKNVPLHGRRRQSRSVTDLRIFGNLGSDSNNTVEGTTEEQRWDALTMPSSMPKHHLVQCPPSTETPAFNRLPQEVLEQIVTYVATDTPTDGYSQRNVDLISCLLVCRALHVAVLPTLYKHITVPHSYIFSKALAHIKNYPVLGSFVKRLDFCHFTSVGLGRTRHMNAQIQNLTWKTLVQFLELVPNLTEFLAQSNLEDDLSEEVLVKLFVDLPHIRALDFCSCSSSSFRTAFESVLFHAPIPSILPITRLSLHECTNLPPSAFAMLLPRLPHLTHLDVAHTQITSSSLFSIPVSARITHLNLARCTRLFGSKVVTFLVHHPAVKDTLVYLNLLHDISRYRLLQPADVEALLPHLPRTLRSLNLNGALIEARHLPLLVPLTKHLEELGLGSTSLTISDIATFFPLRPPEPSPLAAYMDTPVSTPEPTSNPGDPCTLRYLDLTLPANNISRATIFSGLLFAREVSPLLVIELSEPILKTLKASSATNEMVGWTVRELGRRGWYVKDMKKEDEDWDDGEREWKMGARWWGMRKVNVAKGEVGGTYGYHMFKK